jgi:hypothetical protein
MGFKRRVVLSSSGLILFVIAIALSNSTGWDVRYVAAILMGAGIVIIDYLLFRRKKK